MAALVPLAVITAALGMILALAFGPWMLWLGLAIAIGGPAIALGSHLYVRRRLAADGKTRTAPRQPLA